MKGPWQTKNEEVMSDE